jgi:hypothetical protein
LAFCTTRAQFVCTTTFFLLTAAALVLRTDPTGIWSHTT